MLDNLRSSITIFLMPLSKVIVSFCCWGRYSQHGKDEDASCVSCLLGICSRWDFRDGYYHGDTVELTVADLSGHNSKLTLPLRFRAQQSQLDNPASRWRVYDCSLFFNSTSSLTAVGITTESETPQRLQVAVADFRMAKWLSDFGVEPRKELGSRANLAGFLRDTDSVVVIRNWNSSESESIAALLFSTRGEQLPTQPPVRVL